MKAIALSAVVVALLSSLTIWAAPKADKDKALYVQAYAIADLPVWRTNLKETQFAPQVLIKY